MKNLILYVAIIIGLNSCQSKEDLFIDKLSIDWQKWKDDASGCVYRGSVWKNIQENAALFNGLKRSFIDTKLGTPNRIESDSISYYYLECSLAPAMIGEVDTVRYKKKEITLLCLFYNQKNEISRVDIRIP